MEEDVLRRRVPQQDPFRQRWAFIGRMELVTDQMDAAVKTQVAQSRSGSVAGKIGTDDGNRTDHDSRPHWQFANMFKLPPPSIMC